MNGCVLRTQRWSLTVVEGFRTRGTQEWVRKVLSVELLSQVHTPAHLWPLKHDCQLSDKKPVLYGPASTVVDG